MLRNKFVPSEHTTEPQPPYERRQALLLPKVKDECQWKQLDSIICDRLSVVWSRMQEKDLDDQVFQFEEIVHHTISEVCGKSLGCASSRATSAGRTQMKA